MKIEGHVHFLTARFKRQTLFFSFKPFYKLFPLNINQVIIQATRLFTVVYHYRPPQETTYPFYHPQSQLKSLDSHSHYLEIQSVSKALKSLTY